MNTILHVPSQIDPDEVYEWYKGDKLVGWLPGCDIPTPARVRDLHTLIAPFLPNGRVYPDLTRNWDMDDLKYRVMHRVRGFYGDDENAVMWMAWYAAVAAGMDIFDRDLAHYEAAVSKTKRAYAYAMNDYLPGETIEMHLRMIKDKVSRMPFNALFVDAMGKKRVMRFKTAERRQPPHET